MWETVKLENVVEINPRLDKSLFNDDLEVSFVPMPAVDTETGLIDVSKTKCFGEVKKGYTPFCEGDILFAKITPCMENGKMAVVPSLMNHIGFGSTEFHVLRCYGGIVCKYIYYFVSSKRFRLNAEHKMTGAVGQRRVPTEYIKGHNIPIPSSAEQNQVVSIIEQLFSDHDNAIDNLKKAKDQLKVYRQSVLKYAFEGNLTKLTQEDFIQYKVLEIVDVGTGATPKKGLKKFYHKGNTPWITSGSVNSDIILSAKEMITETAIMETNCKVFPKGSLVVAMYGEGKTRGKVSELGIDAATNQACAVLVFGKEGKVDKMYVKYYLRNEYESMRRKASGGVQPNLNLGIIKNLRICTPIESKEQKQIVQEIESRFSVCDNMEETIENSLKQAEALRQSILKQAFEGKLTEEWRKNNPELISGENSAKVLLEKIKAERETLQSAVRKRQKIRGVK
ncbi:restriction endonuclease subunit S [Chlamydiota bacterium]